MANLRLFLGQGFKSHTFQVLVNPLKCIKAAMNEKKIKLYLTNCSEGVSAKNRIHFLRGFQPLCHVPGVSQVGRYLFPTPDLPSSIFAAPSPKSMFSTSFERSTSHLFGGQSSRLLSDF